MIPGSVQGKIADELLDRCTFSPPAVGGHPRNCIPPDSRPEEYVCMFLGVLLEEIVVDTNVYGRRKFSLKSACPDNNHRAWVDITLEEMKAFLGLAVNMSLTRKGDVKEYWSLNPSQAFPFFRQVFTRDRFLDILYSPLPYIGRISTQAQKGFISCATP